MEDTMEGRNLNPLALHRVLPENSAEYMIFISDDDPTPEAADSRPLSKLEAVRKEALRLSGQLTKDYIWQREKFNLGIASQKGLLYLHGITDYGDCVEDEWLIVYMLCELSKLFPNVWARISDSDGEFLLVEAAKVVPRWLNPEIDANRVWIHGGHLKIIPQIVGSSSLSLAESVKTIKATPEILQDMPDLESEAFYRLNKYPGHIAVSAHYAHVLVPRIAAFVLHNRPQVIAPAVEAFYMRDPEITKCIFSDPEKLRFPPVDLVSISVKFSRVLFAQLRGFRFTPPEAWSKEFAAYVRSAADKENCQGLDGKTRVMANLGMKLTYGLELMAATAATNNNRIVREVGLILEDLAEGDEDSGQLPTDDDIQTWKDVNRDDDESWLDINFKDFEQELDRGKIDKNLGGNAEAMSSSGFGDSQVQADLQRMVTRFQAFLEEDEAGIDGINADKMDENDDTGGEDDSDADGSEVSFNEEIFTSLMREMTGFAPENLSRTMPHAGDVQQASPTASLTGTNGAGDADEDKGILDLAAQFEAELKEHGALRLNSSAKQSSEMGAGETNGSGSDEEGEVDVDYNLARNLLESFKGQAGMAGPAGNILGMLGISLPRDDDEIEDDG